MRRGTQVIVFAKAPIAGQVKTRLIPALGAASAAALHARLLERALTTATSAGVGPVELCCAPPCEHPFFASCRDSLGIELTAQAPGELGLRMTRALAGALSSASRAILIGSDCPALRVDDLRGADRALRAGNDVVLMPVADGGYALIAVRRLDPRLFAGIEWSTRRVMAQTRARLGGLGWKWTELPSRWDVDRPEDLVRLREEGWSELLDGATADGRLEHRR